MDRAVFLDTNGWIALLNARDSLHRQADARWRELGSDGYTVVVTDWIIAEAGNGLARSPGRKAFARAVAVIENSPRTNLVYVTESLLERALDLYTQRDDKTWGLVDCASFLVMQDYNLHEAFTNDRHFEQAGFECLLSNE